MKLQNVHIKPKSKTELKIENAQHSYEQHRVREAVQEARSAVYVILAVLGIFSLSVVLGVLTGTDTATIPAFILSIGLLVLIGVGIAIGIFLTLGKVEQERGA
jgi:hypothetical protein